LRHKIIVFILLLCSWNSDAVTFKTIGFTLEIDTTGQIIQLTDTTTNKNYIAPGQSSPILQLLKDDIFVPPIRATWNPAQSGITLQFPESVITLTILQKESHITIELTDIVPGKKVDRILWGPIATSISDTVGEVIGVVRNDTFAIGMLGMNPKTLGGPVDNSEARDVSRSRSAIQTEWGSTLQAYSIDRTRPRTADVWGGHFKNMPIPPIPGETLIGSKVAFFGTPASNALDRIGEIELAEGLPHPIHNGTWSKQNPDLGRS
jgi:hypothetical protein